MNLEKKGKEKHLCQEVAEVAVNSGIGVNYFQVIIFFVHRQTFDIAIY